MADRPELAEPPYTAWHHLLIHVMESLIDPATLTILPFCKLGTLPLEADALLLLRDRARPALQLLGDDFDFLLRRLAPVNVLEYKSPSEVLTPAHLDKVLVYALLAKGKHKIESNEDVQGHICIRTRPRTSWRSARATATASHPARRGSCDVMRRRCGCS